MLVTTQRPINKSKPQMIMVSKIRTVEGYHQFFEEYSALRRETTIIVEVIPEVPVDT